MHDPVASLEEGRRKQGGPVAVLGRLFGTQQGDLAAPGWTQGVRDLAPFDIIVSGFAIHHLPDVGKKRVYREIFDLLAPGLVFTPLWRPEGPDDLFLSDPERSFNVGGVGRKP